MAAYSVTPTLLFFTTIFLLFAHQILSSDPPAYPPSPSPSYISGPARAPSPAYLVSPPASPLPDLIPNSPPSPAPSPSDGDGDNADDDQDQKSPSPAPAVIGDKDQSTAGNLASNDDDNNGGGGGGGMNGGKKAGVAIGVIAGVCVVGLGALVYKKRQDNLRRSQYGYAARREIL